ncbi:MAG: hypothetical protein U1E73_07210 [Planctomycetota bacterium]
MAPSALAQGGTDKPVSPAPVAQDKPGTQDLEKTPPAAKTSGQILEELNKEKERLEKEIRYAKERVAGASRMLVEKLGQRGQEGIRSIDAGTNAPPVSPISRPKTARVMTAEELGAAAKDVMLTVNGQPITQGEFDGLLDYLKGLSNTGTDDQRSQRVLFELIRTQAVASAFPENTAQAQIVEAFGNLENGTAIQDLCTKYGSVFGASDGGKVELTRNSVHGLRLEQIAFGLEEGKHSRPFRTPFGYCFVQVDKIEKGASPELDKRTIQAVQVKYMADEAQLNMAQANAARGQVDILVRDQKVLDMLPMMYRPAPPPAAPANPLQNLQQSLESVENAIKALSADNASEDGKAELESLKAQRDKLKATIEEMKKAMLEEAGDGIKKIDTDAPKSADGAVKAGDGVKKAPAPDKKP